MDGFRGSNDAAAGRRFSDGYGKLARAALAGAALACASPALAQEECLQWDVSGRWYITQSNVGSVVFDLDQRGNVVTGRAGWSELVGGGTILGIIQQGQDPAFYSGSVDGTVSGNRFELRIYWPTHKAVGVYAGEIGPRGRIEGTTYDKLHPKNRATWFSESLMRCAKVAVPKPVRAIGKRQGQAGDLNRRANELKVAPSPQIDSLRVQPGVGQLNQQRLKAPCLPPKC